MNKYTPTILTLIVFVVLQLLSSVALLLTPVVTGSPFGEADAPAGLSVSVMFAADVLTLLVCGYCLHAIRREVFSTDGIALRTAWRWCLGCLMGSLALTVVGDLVEMPDSVERLMMAMVRNPWGALMAALVGPVFEELVFREVMLGSMVRRGVRPWVAILLSAFLFGAVHGDLPQILFAMPMGVLLGLLYYRTGSIVLSSLMHIVNNSIVVLQSNLLDDATLDTPVHELLGGWTTTLLLFALTAVACIVCTMTPPAGGCPKSTE